ncbi:MAG: hypothetical protein KAS16_06195 [Thermoplasmata archaeon]|nr:hypothetical protein [Thermoplasmata archaeon]
MEKNTVFILGAGASMPFGFPSGDGLKDEIYNLFHREISSDSFILNKKKVERNLSIMATNGYSQTEVLEFSTRLKRTPFTIDEFLAQDNDYQGIGKYAISLALFPKEEEAIYWMFNSKDVFGEPNWYQYLFRLFYKDVPYDEYHNQNIRFITFNYDRSLEYFLFESYANANKDVDEKIAESLLESPVIHVYGKLGSLPWEDKKPSIPFGLNLVPGKEGNKPWQDIELYTMYEKEGLVHSSTEKILHEAENIYFLGFGFDKNNLNRLGFFDSNITAPDIWATAYDKTPPELGRILNNAEKMIRSDYLKNYSCIDFLRNVI